MYLEKPEEHKQYVKPRGFYTTTSDSKWTKDKTTSHFEGTWNKVYWPLIKASTITTVFLTCLYVAQIRTLYSILICLMITLSYQQVVALFYKDVYAMPPMDHQSFISAPNSFVNYMNIQTYVGHDDDAIFGMFKKYIAEGQPKFRYKIKEIGGDYYYEMMSLEETWEKIFARPESPDKELKNQKEIDQYIRDNCNVKLPLDGPPVRIYYQKYNPTDQDHLPVEERASSLVVFKTHHSFCDGVAACCMVLACSTTYDESFFLKPYTKDVRLWQRILLRLAIPFSIPAIINKVILAKDEDNCFTKKKNKALGASGIINASSCLPIPLSDVKKVSQANQATVNDVVLAALTTAFHQLFKEKNDPTKEISIVMPANIRFKFPKTKDQVTMENKFGCMPLTVPVTPDMQSAYGPIKEISKTLKNTLGFIYTIYAMGYWGSQIIPRFLLEKQIFDLSKKYTISFSNTAGALKPFAYQGPTSGKLITNNGSQSYFQVAGTVGFALCIVSQSGSMQATLVSDEDVCDEETNYKLLKLIRDNIISEIDRVKEIKKEK